jgi:ubiquitin-like modifier-activating enzyme ATG7
VSVHVLRPNEALHKRLVFDGADKAEADWTGLAVSSLSVTAAPSDAASVGWNVVGWEPNHKGQAAPRVVRLNASLDAVAAGGDAEAVQAARLNQQRGLAVSAARLNLTLMRWRMLPSLDLPRLQALRCLVLGAGTLGCHLARDLLAWGVRRFTFVDSSRVSHSNPVRQPLFEFADAAAEGGGRLKAQAAAEALRRIVPDVETQWHNLRIPMPGHPVPEGDLASTLESLSALDALVRTHDAVFLLTDTRESRWLPTVMSAAHSVPAITVGLGFDTFLVMRQGLRPVEHADPTADPQTVGGQRETPLLGCYFCSDVVAPHDSTQNRTLDQQCTVTRPGVASVSSALAAELVVALLHHPRGFRAPGNEAAPLTTPTESPLGLVPHMIRGFLSHLHPMLVSTPAVPYCPACSSKVVSEYRRDPVSLMLQAAQDPLYIERLTGLAELKSAMDNQLLDDDMLDMDFDLDADGAQGENDGDSKTSTDNADAED